MAELPRHRDAALTGSAAHILAAEHPRAVPVDARGLEVVQAFPELGVVAEGLSLALDPALAQPFLVLENGLLLLHASLAHAGPANAVLLRHGLEQAWLQSMPMAGKGPAWTAVQSLLACRTAGLYLASNAAPFRARAEFELPAWLAAAYGQLSADAAWTDLLPVLGPRPALIERLLSLVELSAGEMAVIRDNAGVKAAAINLFAALGPLAAPAEALMATGGDTRIAINAETGRNGYGSNNRPLPREISLSSSTASSITLEGYRAAEQARRRMLMAAAEVRAAAHYQHELDVIRSGIARIMGLGDANGIILSASGTDAEVVAIGLCHMLSSEPLISILVGPDETGSGVPSASQGRHFSTRTALGVAVKSGGSIEGFCSLPIAMESIAIRDDLGGPRGPEDIDHDVEAAVARAIASSIRPVVHVLDAAKTGLGAPSIAALLRMRQHHGEGCEIIVDACQMRLDPVSMRAYLGLGAMLQITGSKFYGGPPFSGALVVPPDVMARMPADAALPCGIADYSARAEWPVSLDAIRCRLRDEQNPGLLLRWHAALPAMARFAAIDAGQARIVLERFEQDAAALIAAAPGLALVFAAPMLREQPDCAPGWGDVRTILSFMILRPGSDGNPQAVSLDEARTFHSLLGRDLSAALGLTGSDAEMRIARMACLLGQPVKIGGPDGRPAGALRLCASARLVHEICSGEDGQAGQERRHQAAVADVHTVLEKLRLIVTRFDELVPACPLTDR